GEGSAEADVAVGEVVAEGADAEKDEQEREHHGGVAYDVARMAVVLYVVNERHSTHHHERGQDARDQAEYKYGFLHFVSPQNGNVDKPYRVRQGLCRHPFG